jgi:ABC-type branched-subunit amino acid transport system ATPase component
MRNQAAVEVNAISRRFRRTQALDAVTFRIDRGEIVGYIGPNAERAARGVASLLAERPLSIHV